MSNPLQSFLNMSYGELEERNLAAKEQRNKKVAIDKIQEERMKYLTDEKRIKAVTVCFTDLEGRLHMLDYDKKFLLKSADNLTFDGSSIRGFSQQAESDLRLSIDWPAFYWLPSDVFGPGKVLVFGEVLRAGRHALPRRHARAAQGATPTQLYEKDGTRLPRRQRDRGLPLQGPRRRAALPRDRQVRVHLHRRLLPLAARRRAAHASSTPPPRCSARWASRTRRTTPRWRPRSSR